MRQIKYWKVELFERTVISTLKGEMESSPFFTGYSNEPLDLNRAYKRDEACVSLHVAPESLASVSIRASRVWEAKNTPVYEDEDSFLEAAKPMMKWLSDNQHPHTEVTITINSAELLESQQLVKSDEFLKD